MMRGARRTASGLMCVARCASLSASSGVRSANRAASSAGRWRRAAPRPARLGTDFLAGVAPTPEEIVDGGDTIVALGRYRGTYKATGARVDATFVHVMKFKNGKVVKFRQHTDTLQFQNAVTRTAAAG